MTEKQKTVARAVYTVYVFLLAWLVLLKFALPQEWRYLVSSRRVELIPFAVRETGLKDTVEEMFGNCAVFVPLGAYLAAFFPDRGFLFPVAAGFLTSLVFEIAQFAFAIGAADVTDLIMNTAGAAIGVLIFRLLRRLLRQRAVTFMNALGIAAEALFVGGLTILLLYNR